MRLVMATSNGFSHSTCSLPRNACTMGALRRVPRLSQLHSFCRVLLKDPKSPQPDSLSPFDLTKG